MSPDEVLADWERWADEFQAATAEPIRQAVNDGGKAGLARADDLGIAATWDVTNPYVEDWLAGYTMKFAARINATLHDELKATLIDGLNAGEGIRDLEQRILGVMGDEASAYRAEMIARTESHRAEQMGEQEMWRQSGIAMKKVWQANPDACVFCESMDGAEAEMDEPFLAMGDVISLPSDDDEKAGRSYTVGNYEDVETASLHPNCLLPGAKVMAPDLVGAYSAQYSGLAVEVAFANGARLAVTPNHLLLTDKGFAAAYLLRKGDYVVDGSSLQRIVAGDPDNDREPALIEEVVEALSVTGGVSSAAVPVAAVDLHGDGCGVQGDVNVIRTDCLLQRAGVAGVRKQSGELAFGRTGVRLGSLFCDGSLSKVLRAAGDAADSIVGGRRESAPFFLGRSPHSHGHRFASIPRLLSMRQEQASYLSPIQAELGGEGLSTLASSITLNDSCSVHAHEGLCNLRFANAAYGNTSRDEATTNRRTSHSVRAGEAHKALTRGIPLTQVIDVNMGVFHGTVYDLQTLSSLYICNGVVSSNCRCATIWIEA